MGIKLMPIILSPNVPIATTCSSELNTLSICSGITAKHNVPSDISAMPNMTEADNVFLQRSILCAA
jgi:hypothetical protein